MNDNVSDFNAFQTYVLECATPHATPIEFGYRNAERKHGPPTVADLASMDDSIQAMDPMLGRKSLESSQCHDEANGDPQSDNTALIQDPLPCQANVIAVSDRMPDENGCGLASVQTDAGNQRSLSTKVLTPRGWTTLDQIQVGETITNPVGGTTIVTAVIRRDLMPMYRVTFTDGASTICSNDHLWGVNTPQRKFKGKSRLLMTLDEIAAKGLSHANGNLQNFILLIAPAEHAEADLPIDPYLLGLLLGDGGLTTNTPRMTTADEEIRASVESLLPDGVSAKLLQGSEIDYSLSKKHRSNTPNPLTVAIRQLGLGGLGSAQKFVPASYLFSSAKQRTAILQGILDTDGSLDKSNGVGVEFTSTSRRLAEDVRSLVQSLGGTTSPIVIKRTTCPYKGQIVVGTTNRIHIALPSSVLPFRLTRKLAGLQVRTKYVPTRAIEAIEPIGNHECIGISVASENKLYVTDDYIVTAASNVAIAVMPEHFAPEPAPENRKVYGAYGDFVFDDNAIAAMWANLAAHGMTLEDLAC
jgi:phosphate starvation-inducible PhoH-like protein